MPALVLAPTADERLSRQLQVEEASGVYAARVGADTLTQSMRRMLDRSTRRQRELGQALRMIEPLMAAGTAKRARRVFDSVAPTLGPLTGDIAPRVAVDSAKVAAVSPVLRDDAHKAVLAAALVALAREAAVWREARGFVESSRSSPAVGGAFRRMYEATRDYEVASAGLESAISVSDIALAARARSRRLAVFREQFVASGARRRRLLACVALALAYLGGVRVLLVQIGRRGTRDSSG